MRTIWSRFAIERGWLLGLCVLVLYLWLAPAHIVDGDNAEFATLGALGGIAHPSGYPLYLLWLHAMAWLPGATPAHTAALATAILGALSIVVMHAACRAWGARPLAATVACAIFAAAPVVLAIYTEAEVFALNGLTVAAVLWLAGAGAPLRGWKRAAALGLAAGLGMSNHLTCVLVAPVGLYGMWRAIREQDRWWPVAAGLGGLVLGLTPYVYALVASDSPMSWGKVHDLHELVAMFLREDYGSAGTFLAHGRGSPPMTNLGALLDTLGRAWLYAPLALGLATLVYRCVRRRDGEPRVMWAMLALSWIAAGPVLAIKFNTRPEQLGLYVVQRFHLLPALLLAIPVAVGLDDLARFVPERARVLRRAGAPIVATLGFAAAAGLSLPHVLRVHTAAVQRYVENTLQMLPPHAIVIVSSDEEYFGGGYVQHVLGERPDVDIVSWQLLALDWYRRRVEPHGIRPDPRDGPNSVRLAIGLLDTGRPLFVDKFQRTILAKFHTYPYGTLVRVLARDDKEPSLDELLALNKDIFAHFKLDYPRPGPDDEWPTAIHVRYAIMWEVLADIFKQANRPADAAFAEQMAEAIGPAPQ